MSVEQVVFALGGTVCIVGAVIAVIHRDPRVSGASLLITFLALAVLYAGLAAPVVAAAVVGMALFATVPLIVHFSVPASRAHGTGGPPVSGAALLLGAALLSILAVAITLGEVPVNVSVRSSDGYDLAGLGELLTGRAAIAAAGSVLVLVAAVVSARAAGRDRRTSP